MEQELNGLLLMNAAATLDMSVFVKDRLKRDRNSSPDTKRCAKDLLKEKNQIPTMNGVRKVNGFLLMNAAAIPDLTVYFNVFLKPVRITSIVAKRSVKDLLEGKI
ncbi:hypothetical protein V3C99_018116 [Haemonchus contortus]